MSGTESDKSEDEIEIARSPKKQKVMTVTPSEKKQKRKPRAEKVDAKVPQKYLLLGLTNLVWWLCRY